MEIGEVIETFEFLDDWEDKYTLVIDLGRSLPAMPDTERTDDRLVHGCQSLVWLKSSVDNGRLQLTMDSDAHIVRGLIAIILAALNDKTAADVLAFDMRALFDRLELLEHLSATRGNGLVAMLERIKATATQALSE